MHFKNNYTFFLLLYIALLTTALIPYYTDGCLILGGEGDYALDFSGHLKKYGFMWFSTYGVGMQNLGSCGTGLNILLLWLIENLTGSASITNFVLIFSIYFFPFFAMYLVCKEIKATPFISFLCSLFYVVNPYILYYLTCLNQWNVFSVTMMPMLLWVILKYYHNNFKLFFFFGFISALFSFAYTNPPMLVVIHISIVLSIFMVSYYRNKKLILAQIFKKYGVVFISFVVFNFWWILSFFAGYGLSAAGKIYAHSFAESWLRITVSGHGAIIAKTFSLTTLLPMRDPWYNFFGFWYSSIFARLIVLVPIFMIVYFVLIAKDKRTRNSLNCAIFGVLLIALFFVKGNSGLFGFIYDFMFKYFPLFYIFKSPVEKFGLLYVFIFSVLLLLVIKGINHYKHYKPILGIFIFYLVFCIMPVITGNIIPDHKLRGLGYVSRKYKDKEDYIKAKRLINEDKWKYRTLSLPGVGNYQICMPNYNNKKYTGLDPFLMNTDKPFIAVHHGIHVLYNNISSAKYAKLLGIYNIGKIVINEDVMPWFGEIEKESISELKSIFSKSMPSKKSGVITLYENKNNFMPCIYAVDSTSAK